MRRTDLTARRIRPIERIRAKTMALALKAFQVEPSLGKCNAKTLLAEIFDYLKAGMDEEKIVQTVVTNHATGAPKGQLSLM